MNRTSWILALVVGLVIGIVASRMAGGGPRTAPSLAVRPTGRRSRARPLARRRIRRPSTACRWTTRP